MKDASLSEGWSGAYTAMQELCSLEVPRPEDAGYQGLRVAPYLPCLLS